MKLEAGCVGKKIRVEKAPWSRGGVNVYVLRERESGLKSTQ